MRYHQVELLRIPLDGVEVRRVGAVQLGQFFPCYVFALAQRLGVDGGYSFLDVGHCRNRAGADRDTRNLRGIDGTSETRVGEGLMLTAGERHVRRGVFLNWHELSFRLPAVR